MIYVEAPNYFSVFNFTFKAGKKKIFLAGGITGCPDWQTEARIILADADLIVFNPRRADFPINDPSAAFEQIRWEHDHLWLSDVILFWFPAEQIQPIALFELGRFSAQPEYSIAVGVHPEYPRRQDVEIQMSLCRIDMPIYYSLADTVRAAIAG